MPYLCVARRWCREETLHPSAHSPSESPWGYSALGLTASQPDRREHPCHHAQVRHACTHAIEGRQGGIALRLSSSHVFGRYPESADLPANRDANDPTATWEEQWEHLVLCWPQQRRPPLENLNESQPWYRPKVIQYSHVSREADAKPARRACRLARQQWHAWSPHDMWFRAFVIQGYLS